LLRETANEMGQSVSFTGANIEEAWHRLAAGDVEGHNRAIEKTIRTALAGDGIDCVVLAQLSMTVFLLDYPDPVAEFGVPVFTSGQCGFEYMREVLAGPSVH
jgi:hypothetical protein